jgi:hypothetical protein
MLTLIIQIKKKFRQITKIIDEHKFTSLQKIVNV